MALNRSSQGTIAGKVVMFVPYLFHSDLNQTRRDSEVLNSAELHRLKGVGNDTDSHSILIW